MRRIILDHLFEKAEKARQSSDFGDARKTYREILQKSSTPQDQAEALLGLADVERIMGFFTDSMRHYKQAERFIRILDPVSMTDAQMGWALAARAIGRPTEALRELKKALAFYKRQKDRQGEAFAHWALGGTFRISGDMKRGLKELQTAFRIFKTLEDPEGIAYTCCALGGIFRMLGHYAESGKYYREANRRMRQRKDTFGIAYSYCGLGNVQRMAGHFKQALPFYQKAEKLYGTIGDRVSYAYTLWSIGTTYKMLGEHSIAWKLFQKADVLFKKTGDTRGRMYTYLGFAEIKSLNPLKFHKYILDFGAEAEKIAHSNIFVWESLHFQAQIMITLSLIGEKLLPHNSHLKPTDKTLKTRLNKETREIISLYKKVGSKFHPTSLPINWP